MTQLNYKKIFALGMIAIIFAIIGWVLPEATDINATNISFINATSINITGLTPNSGNNTSLISEMNAGYWEGNETNSNPWEIIITYHNVTSFDAIDFSSRYFSSTGTPSSHEVELMVFCTVHTDYMELKDYHNEPDWYSRTYYISNSHHYIIANGTVFLKLRHTSNGINTHVIRIDVARLIIQPKFRADTNVFNNYTNISSGGADNASLNLKVNKSGDTMTGTLNMSGSTISRVNTISNTTGFIEIYSSLFGNISGVNFDTIATNSTDLYYNTKTLSVSRDGFSMNDKLNMNYNNITNASSFVIYQNSDYNSLNFSVNRSYTGTANAITQFSQSSSNISFRVTGNDLTGGYNFRVNALPDQSQDDSSKSGWSFFIKPSSPTCAGIVTGDSELGFWRAIPGTKSIQTVLNICGNQSVQIGTTANMTMLGVGKGIQIKEGPNAKQGTCTMVAGACTVSNTQITANSRLFYNYQQCNANIGTLYESARTAGTSFTITNTNGLNTCTIAYEIFEPS